MAKYDLGNAKEVLVVNNAALTTYSVPSNEFWEIFTYWDFEYSNVNNFSGTGANTIIYISNTFNRIDYRLNATNIRSNVPRNLSLYPFIIPPSYFVRLIHRATIVKYDNF